MISGSLLRGRGLDKQECAEDKFGKITSQSISVHSEDVRDEYWDRS